MVALRRDAARFRTMQDQCRSIAADRFSLRYFGEQLMSVYREVLGAAPVPSGA
jgi:hypothetical protein